MFQLGTLSLTSLRCGGLVNDLNTEGLDEIPVEVVALLEGLFQII